MSEETVFLVSAMDCMILFIIMLVSVLLGILIYRFALRSWVRRGRYPNELRWTAFLCGLLLLVLSTFLPFWQGTSRLMEIYWWFTYVVLGLAFFLVVIIAIRLFKRRKGLEYNIVH
jgi:uncharacterized membrane protein